MASDDAEVKTPAHSLADHTMGQGWAHQHGADADHDHDDFEFDGPLEENPLWIADNVTLRSVGIDIGSSGTQVIFSRIHMRRLAEDLTSRYYVVSRDTLFLSPVSLTPYASETRIDDVALGAIVDQAYADAGLAPGDIDAGAVILTGEALRRENAQAISTMLSQAGGDFVCATAGHHMESMLAAYGSGAAAASLEAEARVLNIDIGGGTTKLGLCDRGQCVATAAVHVGGRLMVVDEGGTITRLDPAGRITRPRPKASTVASTTGASSAAVYGASPGFGPPLTMNPEILQTTFRFAASASIPRRHRCRSASVNFTLALPQWSSTNRVPGHSPTSLAMSPSSAGRAQRSKLSPSSPSRWMSRTNAGANTWPAGVSSPCSVLRTPLTTLCPLYGVTYAANPGVPGNPPTTAAAIAVWPDSQRPTT